MEIYINTRLLTFSWALYEHNYYRGEICVVVEGDRVNLVAGQKDKDTKIFDFNNRVSSLKPLEFVRIFSR